MTTLESLWLGMAVHLWQTALFVGLVALLAFTLRGTSARVLTALYWTGILKLLLPLPLLGPLADRMLAAAGGAVQNGAAADSGWVTVTVLMYPLQLDPAAPGWSGLPPAFYVTLTAVWAAGMAVMLLRRIARGSQPELGPVDSSLHDTLAAAGLAPSQVRIGPDALGPHVRGGRDALVVLPATLVSKLDHDELLAVLIHEREHLERRDTLRYEAVAIVRTLFWFYPPVWWLSRRIFETTEMSCDEAVVRAGLSPATYCRSLARTLTLGLAENAAFPVGVVGHRVSFLRRRLERIRSGRRFEAMFQHRLTVVVAALAALALSVLPLPPAPSLHAQDTGLVAGEGLDALAGADVPVMLDLKGVRLGKLFESLSKTSGVEFLVDEELAGRPITVKLSRSPLKMALKHVGIVAGVKYEVVGRHTVQVRPVLLAGADGVTLPVVIQESVIQPEYPAEAREARIEGRVILQARIGREGNVGDVEVLYIDPVDFEPFAESAVKAVGQWRYRPATQDGRPVEVYFTIRVQFELRKDAMEEGAVL